jgi:hypothetical protein
MAIASISLSLPIQHFSAGRLKSHIASTDNLLPRLVEKILSAEEHKKTFMHELPFAGVLNNRAQKIEGCIRIVGWVVLLIDFFKHAFAAGRVARADLTQGDNRSKLIIEGKETFVSLVTFSSVTASLLHWADTVRILVLGKIVHFLQKFVYAANLIVSGFGIEKTICALKKEKSALAEEQSPPARDLHRHRYSLALVDLAYHISTIVWAIVGLVELVGGVALSPLLTGSLFMISCGLAFVALGLSLYIEFKIAPLAAPPASQAAIA